MKTARGGSHSKHERNRMRGTVFVISTIFTNFVSRSVIQGLIDVSRIRIVKVSIQDRIRGTPVPLVRDEDFVYEGCSPRSTREENHQLHHTSYPVCVRRLKL